MRNAPPANLPETARNLCVEVRGLCKSHYGPGGEIPILDELDLELCLGDQLAILGPSGAGKSTLLHLLGGLETPTRGWIRIAGIEPAKLPPVELARFRNQTIGFVFQDHYLLPQCTVLENVLVPTLAAGGADAAVVSRAEELLQRVGLAGRRAHRPAELSGGEKQRVAMARALIQRPVLLLCDEPTGSLDRHTADAVVGLLLELHQAGDMVLVMVTHSTETASRLTRRAELRDGRLVDASA